MPGTPSAGHYDPAARSSLHGSGGNAGDGSTGPGPKSPRWSAERRASPAGDARRLASAWRAASRARRGTASWCPASLGAPPPLGVAKGKLQTPGAKRVAGTRKDASNEWRGETAFCENEPNDAKRQACENEPNALSSRFVKTKPKFQLTIRYSPASRRAI